MPMASGKLASGHSYYLAFGGSYSFESIFNASRPGLSSGAAGLLSSEFSEPRPLTVHQTAAVRGCSVSWVLFGELVPDHRVGVFLKLVAIPVASGDLNAVARCFGHW